MTPMEVMMASRRIEKEIKIEDPRDGEDLLFSGLVMLWIDFLDFVFL